MLKRLAALAGAVGTTAVGPMATDTWQATRSGVGPGCGAAVNRLDRP
jgi:hypothetical protein